MITIERVEGDDMEGVEYTDTKPLQTKRGRMGRRLTYDHANANTKAKLETEPK